MTLTCQEEISRRVPTRRVLKLRMFKRILQASVTDMSL